MNRDFNKPGAVLADMHGKSLRTKMIRTDGAMLDVRNIVEWVMPDADLRDMPGMAPPRDVMVQFFSRTCALFGGIYINKHLVVLGEETHDGWTPAGYVYDGRRVGFCEVRLARGETS